MPNAAYFKNSGKIFFSMAFLAGFLPVMIWLVVSKGQFNLVSKADENRQIRLWVEPPEIVMSAGQTYTFNLFAQANQDNLLIPSINLNTFTQEGLTIINPQHSYTSAFGGKTVVGTVEVIAEIPGTYSIYIDEPSVDVGLKGIPVVSAPAKVIVQ